MSIIQNPNVPFNVPIPGGMSAGKMVLVQGTIPSMSQRFAVNLLTRSGDIAVHICPRFKENQVVRNNVHNMNWGPEERHGTMPVFAGETFDVMILCEAYAFKIAFNGRHFTEFKHRVPFNTITNLAVDGQVVVHKVNFKEPSGSNNNNPSSPGYGFQPVAPTSSGGLYPSVPTAPSAPSGGLYPDISTDSYPSKPNSDSGKYNSGGSLYPQTPSHPPSQPGYPNIPHPGSYPEVPGSRSGGHHSTSDSGSGFLGQAGMALAGVLGPAVINSALNRRHGDGQGKHSFMDDAGRALAGVLAGSALAGLDRSHGNSSRHHPQSGFLDHAGSSLAGLLAGGGLTGTSRSQRDILSNFSRPHQPSGFLGGALADIIGGGGLTGTGRSHANSTRPHAQSGLFDQAGGALAQILGGGGVTGRSYGDSLSSSTRPRTQSGGSLDQIGSTMADIIGGGGSGTDRSQRNVLSNSSRPYARSGSVDRAGSSLTEMGGGDGLSGHNRNRFGVLGGTLGTALAGAALTGHLNPIKAAKKQLKAQKKAQKKALKYGLPLAGAGLGAYALHKGLKKLHRSSSSSSCSSSD